MRIIVLPEAIEEFENAAHYYGQQQPGLGSGFGMKWIGIFDGSPPTRICPASDRVVTAVST